jgi:hypothetical protein
VPDEEALLVVVGVDEPAGDVVGGAAADGAGRRVVDVEAADVHDLPGRQRSARPRFRRPPPAAGEQPITAPLLYLSAHLEQNRATYYERLQAVRERGEVQEWLQFFLQAVSTPAADAVTRAEDLVDLREEFRSRLRGKRSRANEVVDLLFGNPVMTVRIVVNRLGVTPQGATLLLRQLVEAEIPDQPRTRPGRRTRYTCQALMRVLVG